MLMHDKFIFFNMTFLIKLISILRRIFNFFIGKVRPSIQSDIEKSGKNNWVNLKGRDLKILLVSYYAPSKAHAGGLRILDLYSLIRNNYPSVQIDLFTFSRPEIDWDLTDAYNIFHNVFLSDSDVLSSSDFKRASNDDAQYDVVDLQFHQSGYQIEGYKEVGKKIIYTPMESLAKSFYLDLRQNKLAENILIPRKVASALRLASEELAFIPKVDKVVCVSKSDAAFLRAITPFRNVVGLETGISQFEFSKPLSDDYQVIPANERDCTVLYIAYFGSETNVIALRWYLDNVHRIIKEKVPGYVLSVVGRGDLSEFINDDDCALDIVGEVVELQPYIEKARVGIAPALGGSGFRGKVNQYSVMGIPTVTTPIAAKGLMYTDKENIFIEKDPEEFALRCIELLTDTELNNMIGNKARQFSLKRHSWPSKIQLIEEIYNLKDLEKR